MPTTPAADARLVTPAAIADAPVVDEATTRLIARIVAQTLEEKLSGRDMALDEVQKTVQSVQAQLVEQQEILALKQTARSPLKVSTARSPRRPESPASESFGGRRSAQAEPSPRLAALSTGPMPLPTQLNPGRHDGPSSPRPTPPDYASGKVAVSPRGRVVARHVDVPPPDLIGTTRKYTTRFQAPRCAEVNLAYPTSSLQRKNERGKELKDGVMYPQCRSMVYRPTDHKTYQPTAGASTSLELEHCFGYRCVGGGMGANAVAAGAGGSGAKAFAPPPMNLHVLPGSQELCWYTAALVVLSEDSPSGRQRFFDAHDDEVTALCVSPVPDPKTGDDVLASGQAQLVGTSEAHVYVWTVPKRGAAGPAYDEGALPPAAIQATFRGFRRRVCCLDFSHDGKLLCAVGGDEHYCCAVWDWRNGALLVETATASAPVYAMRFNPYQAYGGPDADGAKPGQAPTWEEAVYTMCSVGHRHVKFWTLVHHVDVEDYVEEEDYSFSPHFETNRLSRAERRAHNAGGAPEARPHKWYLEGNSATFGAIGAITDMYCVEFIDDSSELNVLDADAVPQPLAGTSDRLKSRIVAGTRTGDIYVFRQPLINLSRTADNALPPPWWCTGHYRDYRTPPEHCARRLWDSHGRLVSQVPCSVAMANRYLVRDDRMDYDGPLGHRDGVTALSYSRKARLLLSAGADGVVRAWDPHRPERGPNVYFELQPVGNAGLSFSRLLPPLPDKGAVFSNAALEGHPANLPPGGRALSQHVATHHGHKDEKADTHVRAIAWADNAQGSGGYRVIMGTTTNCVYDAVIDGGKLAAAAPKKLHGGHHSLAAALDCHPFRHEFATAGRDKQLSLWSMKHHTCSGRTLLPRAGNCLAYHPAGRVIVVGMPENEIILFALELVGGEDDADDDGGFGGGGGGGNGLESPSFKNPKKRAAQRHQKNRAYTFTFLLRRCVELTQHMVSEVAPAGHQTAGSPRGGYKMKRVDASRGHNKDGVTVVKFSPHGDKLAVGSHDRTIYLFDVTLAASMSVQILRKLNPLRMHTGEIKNLDWSKDGAWLQSTATDFELLYWRIDPLHYEGAPRPWRPSLYKRPHDLRDMEWATWTCSLGWPVMGIWPESRDARHTDNSRQADVNKVTRSGGRDCFAVADDYKFVRFGAYPCLPGSHTQECHGHSTHVASVCFSHDDAYVVSLGGVDATILLWRHMAPDGAPVVPSPRKRPAERARVETEKEAEKAAEAGVRKEKAEEKAAEADLRKEKKEKARRRRERKAAEDDDADSDDGGERRRRRKEKGRREPADAVPDRPRDAKHRAARREELEKRLDGPDEDVESAAEIAARQQKIAAKRARRKAERKVDEEVKAGDGEAVEAMGKERAGVPAGGGGGGGEAEAKGDAEVKEQS